MNTHVHLVVPCDVNRKVEPILVERPVLSRGTNAEARSREYLLPAEIEKLVKAAKGGRWGARDAALITTGYRHGLRAVEIAGLQWSQVEFGRSAKLHVRRAKGGTPSVHPIYGDELRMLTALRKANPDSQYVFTTERNTPFGPDGINKLIKIIGVRAKLAMPIHAHMLRHSCGYALANRGVDTRSIQSWLGHASITHTTRYTALSSTRFADFFRD
jgi:integrase